MKTLLSMNPKNNTNLYKFIVFKYPVCHFKNMTKPACTSNDLVLPFGAGGVLNEAKTTHQLLDFD